MKQKSNYDLEERTAKFGESIISFCRTLNKDAISLPLISQLVRSATSIGANLIEGKASSSRLEFKKFYEIALKSANETKYWLELLRDSGLADKMTINSLLDEAIEIANMLGAGVIKLKAKLSNF